MIVLEKHSLNTSHALLFSYIIISILQVSTVWDSVSFEPRAEPQLISILGTGIQMKCYFWVILNNEFNPLNTELNPICQ